jgi:phospholipase C
VVPTYQPATESISVAVTNKGAHTVEVVMTNVYNGDSVQQSLLTGKSFTKVWHLKEVYGWYDLTIRAAADASFLQHLAGHVETGKDSATDPAIGGQGRAP